MILVIIIFIFIGLIEIPTLVKQESWKELKVFSAFFLVAFTLAIVQSAGVEVPSPVKGMIYVVKDVLHISY